MTLLNGLLALGALAFTVPLAIHLLFRSRFTTIDWGAMHLLDSVIRINRRRLQLMNLLLLLLRCLIPILLAFCLARPVLTGFQTLPGDAPQSLVLAIDDSQSMAVRDPSGNTRMEQAQQDLNQIIDNLSRRDEVILIRSGQLDRPAASMGPQDAMRKVREVAPVSGPLEIDRLLRAAIDAADDASHPQRRIVVVSDFASEVVGDTSLQGLTQIAKALKEQPSSPVISFLNYGVDSDQLSNVSVDSIVVDSPAVVAGRGASFVAQIRNASDRSTQDMRLVWSIDGQALPARSVTIGPRSTAANRLTHTLDEPGVHEVMVSVEHADSLAADNRRTLGVDVTAEIDVMLVDGDPSRRPLEGETDFLAIALSPFAFGGEDLPDAVRTRVVRDRELASAMAETRPDILILANVKSLDRNRGGLVAEYVFNGGSLVMFDGDAVDTDVYNAGWECEQGMLTLPARLGDRVGDADPESDSPFSIGPLNPQYTPWKLLRSSDEQPFDDVEVYAYRKLEPNGADEADPIGRGDTTPVDETAENPPSITLLEMAGGDPLVVTARRGRGRIVQFAVPCDTGWSTLPLRMVYLPMVQQLMLDLAGRRKQATVAVGETIVVPVEEFGQPNTGAGNKAPEVEYTITTPDLSEQPLEPSMETAPVLQFADTHRRGVYRFRRQVMQPESPPHIDSTQRVVQVPPEESRLRDAEPRRLALAAKTIGARIYGDAGSLESDDRTRRFGREIWRWLLVALLIGMVAELLLQQHAIRHLLRGGVSG